MEQATITQPFFDRAKAAGISISRVCERAGVAPTTPSRWLNQGRLPNLGTLNKLNIALDGLIAEQKRAPKGVAA